MAKKGEPEAKLAEKPGKGVLFQVLSTGNVRGELSVFMAYMSTQGCSLSLFMGHSGYMPCDRNEAVHQWLSNEGGEEYLIQCDQDMVPPMDVIRLAQHKKDLCGLIYLCGSDNGPMVAAKGLPIKCKCPIEGGKCGNCKAVCDRCEGTGTYSIDVYPYDKAKEDPLIEVEWFGTGVYCISRKFAEHMFKKYGRVFDFHWSDIGGKKEGVDVGMCRRARMEGFKVYVDRSLIAGHAKGATWAPGRGGELLNVPWGSYWDSDNVPANASQRRPLPETLEKLASQK